MIIKRPFQIEMPGRTCEISVKKPQYDDQGGLIDFHQLSILGQLKEIKPGTMYMPEIYEEEINTVFSRFEYYSKKIGKLNRFSELINQKLKKSITAYLLIHDIKEILQRNRKCRKLEGYNYEKELTFAELRNIFSCIIKTDKEFEKFEPLDSRKKINQFSKLFENYIFDRNCYTHGRMFFLYPKFEPILKVKPPGLIEHFVQITDEILSHNMMVYDIIDILLDEINKDLMKATPL